MHLLRTTKASPKTISHSQKSKHWQKDCDGKSLIKKITCRAPARFQPIFMKFLQILSKKLSPVPLVVRITRSFSKNYSFTKKCNSQFRQNVRTADISKEELS